MTAPLRLAVLGLHHDHVWSNLEELAEVEGAELTGAADPFAELRDKFAQRWSRPVWEDPGELLAATEPDGVLLFGSNRWSAAWAACAAGQGRHVLVEKPLAADLAGAEAAVAAAEGSGVRLMVNWPFAWWPPLQEALRLAGSGAIGRVWQTRYRAAHEGPAELGCSPQLCQWLFDPGQNGGGALPDYCCYGAILARVVLGRPQSVTGWAGRLCKGGLAVEDNALLLLSYPQAMGLAEASWTQVGKQTAYAAVLYGTEGTLVADPFDASPLRLADAADPHGRPVPVPEPPGWLRSGPAHFVHGIRTGEPFHPLCRPEENRDAQAILEAGRASAERGEARPL